MTAPVSKIEATLATWREKMRSPTLHRVGLVVALIIFAIGTIVAAQNVTLPEAGLNRTALALLVLGGIPAMIFLNAVEMELGARLVGHRFGALRALSTAVLASAANMLPLPGAVMVRFASLSGLGASVRDSGSVTLGLALLWLGVGMGITGGYLFGVHTLAALLVTAGALGVTVVATVMIYRVSQSPLLTLACLILKVLMVMVTVIRLMIAFALIGAPVMLGQVTVFAVSGVAGSAVSIVPAGLGVRELVSSALAPLASIDPAAAFLATASDRLVELVVLMAAAAPLMWLMRPAAKREPMS